MILWTISMPTARWRASSAIPWIPCGRRKAVRNFDFRDKLEEVLTGGDGSEVLTLTGGATGLYCGYVDFIAWDIQEALNMAKELFEGTDIPWAIFHTFRREAGSVSLKQQDDGTETENQVTSWTKR